MTTLGGVELYDKKWKRQTRKAGQQCGKIKKPNVRSVRKNLIKLETKRMQLLCVQSMPLLTMLDQKSVLTAIMKMKEVELWLIFVIEHKRLGD